MAAPGAWHLAQLNVGRVVAPPGDPALADFMAALDGINALAEASPGFVWRLVGADGNATDVQTTADPLFLVNMSVWESTEALFAFTYQSAHTGIMARRREWFERPAEAYQVLWWIPAGHHPTTSEALSKLELLRLRGAAPEAFTFKQRYPSRVPARDQPTCGQSRTASAGAESAYSRRARS